MVSFCFNFKPNGFKKKKKKVKRKKKRERKKGREGKRKSKRTEQETIFSGESFKNIIYIFIFTWLYALTT